MTGSGSDFLTDRAGLNEHRFYCFLRTKRLALMDCTVRKYEIQDYVISSS